MVDGSTTPYPEPRALFVMVVNECIQGVLPKMDNKIAGTRNYFQPQDSNFMHRDTIKLFAGSMCHDLVSEIAQHLNQAGYKNVRPGKYVRSVFANGNIFIRLNESVRGQDVYLIQTMSDPVHDNIFEMLIMIDALKRDSALRINVIFPYMAYGRSDKKDQPRVPITARMLANMIEVAGADRYMTIDLHSGQIQGFFNIPAMCCVLSTY
jgi:ribose-phosphate pyrophosphokinase